MTYNFIHIYNKLVNLTTNKYLYKNLYSNTDTFGDRLLLFLIHFSFFLKIFKSPKNKKVLQNLYDFIFRQIELSIREIGYGDQSINKKMKDYINVLHGLISEIHFWEKISFSEKKNCLSKFLPNFRNIDNLVSYFEDFNLELKKYDLNSYLKSVNKS
jgi:cytochrome b pre-mRNA-processing protein 3